MNEITLDEILAAAHDAEFSQYDNVPEHVFSRKHDRAMKRIFNIYQKRIALLNSDVMDKGNVISHFRWNRKTVIVMLMVIFLAVLAGCSAIIYYLGGFKADVHTDNTQLFPIDLTDCPQSIEEMYYLSELPSGFELLQESVSDISVFTVYVNSSEETITLHQSIKTAFETHYNTENYKLEEILIDEHIGIGLERRKGYIVAWDNGDYILEVSSNLPKSETINLAKSAKVLEN